MNPSKAREKVGRPTDPTITLDELYAEMNKLKTDEERPSAILEGDAFKFVDECRKPPKLSWEKIAPLFSRKWYNISAGSLRERYVKTLSCREIEAKTKGKKQNSNN